jgi:hypothetical protein
LGPLFIHFLNYVLGLFVLNLFVERVNLFNFYLFIIITSFEIRGLKYWVVLTSTKCRELLQMIALTASKYQLNHFSKFVYSGGWGEKQICIKILHDWLSKFQQLKKFAPYYQHHLLLPHKIRVFLWLN